MPPSREATGVERRRPTIGTALYMLALAWGAGIATFPLTDNSFLTHLATGRLILERRSVPTSDPYTFTARGTDWTVQSWLASTVYASAERLGGVVGLRVVVLVVFLAGAWLLWRLSRPCESLVPRIAIVFGALYVVTGLWSERPYMAGVIGLGLVWVAVEGGVRPWVLVPLFWVWANIHGSFPLGLVLIAAVLLGTHLDGEDVEHERRVLGMAAIGTAAAVVSPLGLRILLFPLTALSRSDQLSRIVEWQSPAWRSAEQRAFLAMAAVAVLSLVARPRWRLAIPAVVFIVAAVVAQRNIVMAVMVLVPVLAHGAPTIGRATLSARPTLIRPYVLVGAFALVVGVATAVSSGLGSLEPYPTVALAWFESSPIADERVAARDTVGNLLEGLDGADAQAFVDDRLDMLPEQVIEDSVVLFEGRPGWERVLDAYDVDVVIWDRGRPLASIIAADADWWIVLSTPDTSLACRRGPTCDALGGGGA